LAADRDDNFSRDRDPPKAEVKRTAPVQRQLEFADILGRRSSTNHDRAAARRADAARSGSSFVKPSEGRRRRHRRYGLLRVARPAQPPESTAIFTDLVETRARY
jgi:hypothetical protein